MPLLLPSFRRQQRVLDFTAIQQNHPEGVYVTLSPENPAVWTGVIFVREGPYESAVLRFTIQFPDDFPDHAPVITFSTDIFHPLVVPLTQYTFSAGTLDASSTASASDNDRLPPGAFSLRHGFPQWFKQGHSARSSLESEVKRETPENDALETLTAAESTSDSSKVVLQLLRHLKEAFEDASSLDSIAFNTVGNPSAWHAWRAYRGLNSTQARGRSPTRDSGAEKSPPSPKQMSEWNWDGVWESRVRNAIETSISEAGLFTNQGLVKFAKIDSSQLKEIRQQLQTS